MTNTNHMTFDPLNMFHISIASLMAIIFEILVTYCVIFRRKTPPEKDLQFIRWKTIKPNVVSHLGLTIGGCIGIAV